MWWWAAERRLDANAATEQLIAAYRERHGNVPAAFRRLLSQALTGLPAPGRSIYFPPPYVVSGPLIPRPLPFVLGRPRFGPNEKSGISQISAGIRVPRRIP